MKHKIKFSLGFIAFFQALGLMTYCSLVALLIWRGNELFGRMPSYLGPLVGLILFSTSALVCALITLGYPFVIFWIKKKPLEGLKLVIYTTEWLIFFTVFVLTLLILTR